MTFDEHDDAPEIMDPALDALLRRAEPALVPRKSASLELRVLSRAALPLARRRRAARASLADTLAAWMRVALPLAAAAAIVAVAFLSRIERTRVADAELSDSDPAALLSALESDGSSGLAHHLIAADAHTALIVSASGDPR